jgi:hypothetical protein
MGRPVRTQYAGNGVVIVVRTNEQMQIHEIRWELTLPGTAAFTTFIT